MCVPYNHWMERGEIVLYVIACAVGAQAHTAPVSQISLGTWRTIFFPCSLIWILHVDGKKCRPMSFSRRAPTTKIDMRPAWDRWVLAKWLNGKCMESIRREYRPITMRYRIRFTITMKYETFCYFGLFSYYSYVHSFVLVSHMCSYRAPLMMDVDLQCAHNDRPTLYVDVQFSGVQMHHTIICDSWI